MKTLADFKRRIELGTSIETSYPSGLEIPTRKVSIKQSNSFALSTTKINGDIVDSWMEYPKASMIEFPTPNEATIFWMDRDEKRIPCLTYKFIN